MTKGLARVAERRALLVAKTAAQRETLSLAVQTWSRPLALMDRGLAAFRFVSNHPAWIVGTALVPAALQPGRVGTWLRRGFMAFQAVSRLRAARAQRYVP